jgi:SAM-dependent methyltransferase
MCAPRVGEDGNTPQREPDRLFVEPKLAALYDPVCEGRKDLDFYLPLVMAAPRVLDVGCGTGMLLRLAREAGHKGRLVGLDPAVGMLGVAKQRQDIEWVLGDLDTVRWDRQFDLIVMTGHAFQVLLDDDELCRSLTAIRDALHEDGRFVFETRNPLVREWENWQWTGVIEVEQDGTIVRISGGRPTAEGEYVSFVNTYSSQAWEQPEVSHSTLRFLDRPSLATFLEGAGLAVETQYGDWDGSPFRDTSLEIITVAKRA